MTRSDISSERVAHIIGKSYNTTRMKINGKMPFTLDEAVRIKKMLFPGMTLEYLFKKESEA